jgi:hypothetical protein
VRLEGSGKLKKSNDLIGTRTRDLPACSVVPPLRYRVPPCRRRVEDNIKMDLVEVLVWSGSSWRTFVKVVCKMVRM